MASASTFANSGEDAITRPSDVSIDETASHLSAEEFQAFYEIDRTAREIVDGDYKRIALQFPDELLHDSVPIYGALKSRIGDQREVYVLADTSYGSCCVDEVAAQHVDADLIVHYGHACMSKPYRLPVVYVFTRKHVDVSDCVTKLVELLPSPHDKAIWLRCDVSYAHRADDILQELHNHLPEDTRVIFHQVPNKLQPTAVPSAPADVSFSAASGTKSEDIPIENCTIFYIGGESLGLTNLLMTHAFSEVYSYDPQSKSARLESVRTNKLLMRRYAIVQKAKDADVFGILVGTLGVASYLPLISHIRQLLSKHQKKSYTISVGKLNPAKLGNFMEIECFVLVACPENSMIESKEFLRPIITPYELDIALKTEQSWTGKYVLDFEKLLRERASDGEKEENEEKAGSEEEDTDQPIFSTVTGKYRTARRYGDGPPEHDGGTGSSAVVLRNQDTSVSRLDDSAAAEFLRSRTFQGLETRIGEDAPSVLEQGRSGIARGYRDDHKEELTIE